jgi:hypothetical protein
LLALPALVVAIAPSAALAPGAAAATPPSPSASSVLLAFLPASAAPAAARISDAASSENALEAALARAPGLSIGIMSATQGAYTTSQFVLDVTQGASIASAAYPRSRPPAMTLQASGARAVVQGWAAARRRAEDAPQLLRPGLLAARIPGGGAYAAVAGEGGLDGAVAADRQGSIAAVSIGGAPTLLARTAALRQSKRFVVCDLPRGEEGYADLRALGRGRSSDELLIVVQRADGGPGHELLWAAAAGLAGGGGRELSSTTTNERGLIAAIDLAPTILAHLGLTPIPPDMRGARIHTDGRLSAAGLRSLMARMRVIGGRRLAALAFLLCAWALLLLAAAALPGPRKGTRRAWAMRIGALGVLWAPVAALITAALEPGATVEYATVVLACLALGALTDVLLPWPRGPLAPAIVTVIALVADALLHSQLLMRSLLGPNPILGARFYGIGNELKSGLAVLVFVGVAAALYPIAASTADGRPRDRTRAAATMACAGVLLALVEGSARIGAGVGGVILVSAGTAVATVMLLTGRVTRRRALIVLISPLVGLVVLAALDLATAHGSGHYTGSILHARSAGDLRDVLVRRYGAAWRELKNHAMPVATGLALVWAGFGLRRRDRLLAPVASDPAWLAALAGGLAAGVVGALVEDSGPVLLVVAVFALGCVLSYLWGRPAPASARGSARSAPVP